MEYKNIEWTDEQVKKFWDYESQFPEKYFTHTFGDRILEEVENIYRKKKCFGLWTGIGLLIPHLLKHEFEVTGTDFSHDSIEFVNKRFKNEPNFNGAYYIDDIININKKYDVIFCIEMIEHINDHYLDITLKI